MTSIARLKDRARKHEQQEDWEAAIQAYQEVLQKEEGRDELDLELGLYNRIGDLYLRLGQTDEAVSYYEEAADKYARSGLYNNAIALCNKALRHRPDRAEVYLKLSRLSAEQGFTTDARRWILDYAERQVRAGNVDQAVRGLEEFAESSDDPGVRVLLAQQLAAHGREGQAIEHLRTAHAMWLERGDRGEAAAVLEKARSIDPGVAFHGAGPLPTLDEPDEEVAEVEAEPGEEAEEVEAEPGPAVPIEGLHTGVETADTTEVAGVERLGSGDEPEAADVGSEPPAGLETGVAGEGTAAPAETAGEAMGGLERFDRAPPGPAEDEEAEAEPLPYLDTGYEEEGEEEAEPLPLLDSEPEASRDARETEEAAAAGRGAPDAVEEPGAEEAVAPDEAADTGPEPPEAEAPVEEEAPAEPAMEAPHAEAPTEPEDHILADELPPLDLNLGVLEEPAAEEPANSLDLGSLDLTFPGEEEGVAEHLDVDVVLQRSKELVSRGLLDAAMAELQLLSGSDAGPEVFRDALSVVTEIIRHDANDLSALQRRVEYATRIGDRQLVVDAHIDLADALARLGAETKAQAIYERALDLDPDNEVAREALGVPDEDESTVDLGAILDEMDPEQREAALESAGEADDPGFTAMLSQLRAQSGREEADGAESGDHYDLGIAFKEMGLVDEAIAEFQRALTGGEEQLKVYEELGQCFVLKGQYNVALKVFNRALQVPHADETELLGVYYHLGQCHEELGHRQEARAAYEKVLSIDPSFADVPDRVARL